MIPTKTSLFFISDAASATAQSVLLDRLQKRHQPITSGLYRLDHRLLRSNTTSACTPEFLQYVDIPHLSPCPFILAGSSSIITIDRDFAAILKAKLGPLWTHRQTLRLEGHSFDVDDFRVRVGRLLMGDTVRGVIVEVEYTPVDTMFAGEAVLRDFIDGLQLPFTGRWVVGVELGTEWNVLDTGRLYCELLRLRWGIRLGTSGPGIRSLILEWWNW